VPSSKERERERDSALRNGESILKFNGYTPGKRNRDKSPRFSDYVIQITYYRDKSKVLMSLGERWSLRKGGGGASDTGVPEILLRRPQAASRTFSFGIMVAASETAGGAGAGA